MSDTPGQIEREVREQIAAEMAERIDPADLLTPIASVLRSARTLRMSDDQIANAIRASVTDPLLIRLSEAVNEVVAAKDAEIARLRDALALIGGRCEIHTGPKTCATDPRRTRDGTNPARTARNRLAWGWCNGCIARTALDPPEGTG